MSSLIDRILRLPREERRALLDAVGAKRLHNPISYLQTQMWALERLHPGSPNHLVAGGWRLRGPLDAKALDGAVRAIISKHASLRTHFIDLGGVPLAVESAEAPPLVTADCATALADRSGSLDAEIFDNTTRPFNLEREPGFRVKLLRMGRDEHALLYAAHHIVFDGWSQQLLARQLSEAYGKATAGRPAALAPLSALYADFAEWQRAFMQSDAASEQLEFWRNALAGELPVLELPFANPRPAVRSETGGTREWRVSRDVVAAIDGIARTTGCARFPVLLAAVQSFLSRVTRQRDVILGTPVAGRPSPEFEEVIGYFVNMVTVRTEVDLNSSFIDLVCAVAANATAALDHHEIPFQCLLETLKLPRDPGQSPVFQAALVYDNYPEEPLRLHQIDAELILSGPSPTLYDLNVLARDLAVDPTIKLSYRADLFDDCAADRLAFHLERWIAHVALSPESPLSSHPLLSVEQHDEILVGLNRDRRTYNNPESIHEMFEAASDRWPSQPAIVHAGGSYTYAELDSAANRLAAELQRRGVALEMPVGVYLKRCPEMIVAMLAVLKAGGAYLPLDPAYPAARISFMVADAGAAVVITSDEYATSLPLGTTIVRIDDGERDQAPAARPRRKVRGENLLYVMYTSGSTGLPKGVMVTHAGVRNRLLTLQDDYRLTPSDRVLNKTTFSFDVSVWEIFLPLVTGAAVALPEPEAQRDSQAIVKAIREFDVTMLHFIPSMLRLFLEEPDVSKCTSLRHVVSGGELLPRSLQQRVDELLPWSRLHNHYGPTEGSIEVTSWHCHPKDNRANAPIGRAVANIPVYVLDDYLVSMPVGVVGELYFGGVAVARGYRNAPGRTAERFLPDPFSNQPGARLYRTGDLVRYVEVGVIEFLGRIDYQVKIRGFRVELGEVQATFESHPAVLEAFVDAETDSSGSSHLRAYLVPKGAISTSEILKWLYERLPEFMVPSSVTWLARLPLTPTGKIDRRALPPPLPGDFEAAYRAPATELERELCAMWSGALGVPEFGVDDDFFAAGGHSLLALRMLFAIEQRFGTRLSLKSFLQARTVAKVEALIAASAAHSAPPSAILPMPRDARPVCSFGEERLWFIERFVPGTAAYNVPFAIRMHGALDAQRLRAAVEQVVSRHDILRVSYIEEDGVPVPQVANPGPLDWVELDLRGAEASARDAAWNGLLHERCNRPFILDGSLVRGGLARLSDDQGVFLLVFHHIIVDGWSIKVLFGEISTAYATAACPPPPAIQYRDFAYWQRGQGGVAGDDINYWVSRLAQAEALPVPIPLDRPHPPIRRGMGGLALRPLPPHVAGVLTAAARQYRVGEFSFQVAGLAVMLSRYGGCSEVAIGTPVSGRDHPATVAMIGFLSNQLVLRIEVRPDEPFCGLAVRVQHLVAEALEHQAAPFARMVEHLNPFRATHRNALFDVGFAIEDDPTPALSIPGVSTERMEVDSGGSKFDLELILIRGLGSATLSLTYNREILDPQTADAILHDFERLLTSVAVMPQQVVSSIDFLSPEVKSQLSAGSAALGKPALHLRAALAESSRRFPNRIAVDTGESAIDYTALEARVRSLSAALVELGLPSGTVLGVLVDDPIDLIIAIQAVTRIGAAYLPMVPGAWVARAAKMVRRAGVAAILTTLPDQARDADAPAIDLRECVLCGDSNPPEPPHRPEGLFYGITTSGSTGASKLASATERGFAALLQWFVQALDITERDRVLVISSPVFDLTQKLLFSPLLVGASVHWTGGWHFDPRQIRETIANRGITIINGAPTALRLLLEDENSHSLASLRWVVAGGEAFTPALAHAWLSNPTFRGRLMNSYGVAECSDISLAQEVAPARLDVPIAIGRPIPGACAYVLDSNLNFCPIGVPGELFLGGVGVGPGYLGDPAQTADRFLPDPFTAGARMYRTGDLAKWRRDGAIEYIGRRDYQVKVRGQRIELGEIERVLVAHPSISAAAAVVLAVEEGESEIATYYTSRPPLYPEELRRYLASRLPGAMVPRWLVPITEFPRTETGKIDRLSLPAPVIAATDGAETVVGVVEERVASIWREALSVDRISPRDNFFGLGGHSLLAIRVVRRIGTAFDVDLPLVAFFEAATLRDLARLISEAHVVPRVGEEFGAGNTPALAPAQEAIWFTEQLRPGTPMHNLSETFRISGRIDVDALEVAINRVAMRHKVLRTVYRVECGSIRTVVLDGSVPFLRIAEADGDSRAIAHHAAEEIRRPFRLGEEWPIRARWVNLGGDQSLFIVTAHHIAYDGRSHELLLSELGRFYEALMIGRELDISPLEKQYADFGRLQIEQLSPRRVESVRRAWSTRLANVDWRRALPFDRQSSDDDIVAARETFTLDSEAVAAVQACARKLGATPFTVLLAGFRCAVGKWTGRLDDCLGTVVAGRPEAFEDVVGLFSNLIPLFIPLEPDASFESWIRRCQEELVESLSLGDVPMARALAGLRPPADPRPEPPFQVTFALQPSPAATPLRLVGTDVQLAAAEVESATFPLQFFLAPAAGNTLRCEVVYRRGWLERRTIKALAGWFIESVTRGVADLAVPVRALLENKKAALPGVVHGTRRRLQAAEITRTPLAAGARGPILFTPTTSGVDLPAYVVANVDAVRRAIIEHGAVWFRGFSNVDERQFQSVAVAISGELVSYVEGSSPRRRLGRGLYTSTEYPHELPISMHNELSYAHWWPRHLFLYCRVAPEAGGETPLADSRAVLQHLPASIVAKFRARRVRYLRRLRSGAGLGLSWQEVFETEDRASVERYCRDGAIAFEWEDDGALRTSQDRQAVIEHPDTGELCWFNQVHQWHPSNLGPGDARILAGMAAGERPLDATYGDGAPLEDDALDAIRRAYAACEFAFPWQAGDIVVVDNTGTAHGRRPFSGRREVLVLLGGRVAASDVATI